MHRLKLKIHGKVQGVGYRYFLKKEAGKLGITGDCMNLADGSVECTAQGAPENLKKFLDHCHTGPLIARVDRIDSEWEEGGNGDYNDFQIIV